MMVHCPRCNADNFVDNDVPGKKIQCTSCGRIFAPKLSPPPEVLATDETDILIDLEDDNDDTGLQIIIEPEPSGPSLGDLLFSDAPDDIQAPSDEHVKPTAPTHQATETSQGQAIGVVATHPTSARYHHQPHPTAQLPIQPEADSPGGPGTAPTSLEPSQVANLVVNTVVTVVALGFLTVFGAASVLGLEPPTSTDKITRFVRVISGERMAFARLDGIQVTSFRSVLYRSGENRNTLVFFGEVENLTDQPADNIYVSAVLYNDSGTQIRIAEGPVGLSLSMPELVTVGARKTYNAIVSERTTAAPVIGHIAPHSRAGFTVVIEDPPEDVHQLEHRVGLRRNPPVPAKKQDSGLPALEPFEKPAPDLK